MERPRGDSDPCHRGRCRRQVQRTQTDTSGELSDNNKQIHQVSGQTTITTDTSGERADDNKRRHSVSGQTTIMQIHTSGERADDNHTNTSGERADDNHNRYIR